MNFRVYIKQKYINIKYFKIIKNRITFPNKKKVASPVGLEPTTL